MDPALRPLMPDDASTARAFVSGYFESPRYRARALEALQCALEFDDPEYMALIAVDEGVETSGTGDALAGIALFGTVAGAHAVVKLHGVLARDVAPARSLVEAVVRASQQSGERMIVCELPDDSPFAIAVAALLATGFTEQGRVPDFVRDGVALRLLVRPLLEA